jgi:hypothetical protein
MPLNGVGPEEGRRTLRVTLPVSTQPRQWPGAARAGISGGGVVVVVVSAFVFAGYGRLSGSACMRALSMAGNAPARAPARFLGVAEYFDWTGPGEPTTMIRASPPPMVPLKILK